MEDELQPDREEWRGAYLGGLELLEGGVGADGLGGRAELVARSERQGLGGGQPVGQLPELGRVRARLRLLSPDDTHTTHDAHTTAPTRGKPSPRLRRKDEERAWWGLEPTPTEPTCVAAENSTKGTPDFVLSCSAISVSTHE